MAAYGGYNTSPIEHTELPEFSQLQEHQTAKKTKAHITNTNTHRVVSKYNLDTQ